MEVILSLYGQVNDHKKLCKNNKKVTFGHLLNTRILYYAIVVYPMLRSCILLHLPWILSKGEKYVDL